MKARRKSRVGFSSVILPLSAMMGGALSRAEIDFSSDQISHGILSLLAAGCWALAMLVHAHDMSPSPETTGSLVGIAVGLELIRALMLQNWIQAALIAVATALTVFMLIQESRENR
ncbi:hypothetical protein AB0G15_05890 [Streptosporangium sp. NPDC023825]|uniref:hypothetical protein n=1 Tax=Streptosporangium sp. NPDC023825 TaxID=3154909 RepID=UPI00341C0AFC